MTSDPTSRAQEEERLLFDWVSHQDRRTRLALWILLALALHAGCYFLFRVTYPPARVVPISDAAVIVVPPGSEDARAVAALIETQDPAVFATDRMRTPSLADPVRPGYEPTYKDGIPALRDLPEAGARPAPLVVETFGAVPMPETATPPEPSPPPSPRQTRANFLGSLAGRGVIAAPSAKFVARPGDKLEPAEFLVAISPAGQVLHSFLRQPSGNPDLDAAATKFVMGHTFSPSEKTAWGTAIISWGADVEREPPR